ncbi:hypothetical protein ACNQR7_30135 [Mycolicibacterium senegalense]|uniref:hypothetical protein n=1 Tax=Mycolicibacterium senegalense TaxID=1796 RepID=UPI003AAD6611
MAAGIAESVQFPVCGGQFLLQLLDLGFECGDVGFVAGFLAAELVAQCGGMLVSPLAASPGGVVGRGLGAVAAARISSRKSGWL